MTPDTADDSAERNGLPPQTITDRFDGLEAGDQLSVNDRERTYEVVDTDTYSVIAEDPDGNLVTFSQNLQSGGWSLCEDVFHVAIRDR